MTPRRRRQKPWKNLPKEPVNKENLRLFWAFLYERHMIWYRRFHLKLAPPWTRNPILSKYKFTNIYRELDRGTLWLIDHIVNSNRLKNATRPELEKEMFWEIILYRLLNRVETFDKVGIPTIEMWKHEPGKHWKSALRLLHKKGPVFTNAHLTLPQRKEGANKLDLYFSVLNFLHKNLDSLFEEVKEAKSLEDAWRICRKVPCVGAFIAYEVVVDFMYAKIIPFTEDDWVNPGPGCKVGIRLIFPDSKSISDYNAIVKLRDEQEKWFAHYRLDFPFYEGRRLTLRNVEHSLCEFGKYWKTLHGVGKYRMKFVPTTGVTKRQLELFQ